MAASCILDAVNSVLAQVGDIPFDWSTVEGAEKSRPNNLFQLVRMWNNQVAREQAGNAETGAPGYIFAKPACFVEMQPEASMQFLENVTFNDICWKLHIVDSQLNTNDEEGMDQNLSVYGFRDLVKQYMTAFSPDNCGTMFSTDERQDYDHAAVYHYILDMKCGFTDTKGSISDPDQVRVIYSTPPTNLELETGFADGPEPPVDPVVSYIWKVCEVFANIVDTPDPDKVQVLGNGVTIPLEYALNDDGTFTIPYLANTPGATVLTPFMIGNQPYETVYYSEGVFTNTSGGFIVTNEISFNASLPLGADT